MSTLKWAQEEVARRIEKELEYERQEAEKNGEPFNENDFHYGVECYKSALRAYECLAKEGHSGFSWSITRSILERLMHDLPLSPIEGTEDEWDSDGQNKRRFSLFRKKQEDGSYTYSDSDRVLCCEEHNGRKDYTHFGFVTRMINELHPITFPYFPTKEPIKVFTKTFDHEHGQPGSFDTLAVFNYILPNEPALYAVDKYFKENEKGIFVEIPLEEYNERLERYSKICNNAEKKDSDDNCE